jgi:hypothetical protein
MVGSFSEVCVCKKRERREEQDNERSLAMHSRNLNALSRLTVGPL